MAKNANELDVDEKGPVKQEPSLEEVKACVKDLLTQMREYIKGQLKALDHEIELKKKNPPFEDSERFCLIKKVEALKAAARLYKLMHCEFSLHSDNLKSTERLGALIQSTLDVLQSTPGSKDHKAKLALYQKDIDSLRGYDQIAWQALSSAMMALAAILTLISTIALSPFGVGLGVSLGAGGYGLFSQNQPKGLVKDMMDLKQAVLNTPLTREEKAAAQDQDERENAQLSAAFPGN